MKVRWIYLFHLTLNIPAFLKALMKGGGGGGVEGRTVVTDEYHLQQTETDGQQEVQDAIGIAVADQNEVQDTSVMAEMN